MRGGFLTKRLVRMGAVVVGTVLLAFAILHLSGDPTSVLLPPDATPEHIEQVRREMGLDQPIWVQFYRYTKDLASADFGESFVHRRPALSVVLERLPATYELILSAMFLALLLGVPLGLIAATSSRRIWERIAEALELLGQAIPGFWLGLTLILVFAVYVPIFPVSGRGSLLHLVLPAVTLASFVWPTILRTTRASVSEVVTLDFVRTARAKGLSESVVIGLHVFGNALVPILAVGAFQLAILIGGAVITETVFSWPGVGRAMVNAIYARDYPVVQAGVLVFVGLMIVINLVVDVMHAVLDPRVRLQ